MQRLLKLEEAAALLGISPSTLANWRAAKTGPQRNGVTRHRTQADRRAEEAAKALIEPAAKGG